MEKSAVHICMLVLFFLSVFAAAVDSKAENSQALNDEAYFAADPSDNGPHSVHHLPFGSNAALPGAETPDENESEEGSDFDDDDSSHRNHTVGTSLAKDSLESLRLHYRRLFQNRPAISLIILYHSWKSHLS